MNWMRAVTCLALIPALAAVVPTTAHAQGSGRVAGTVTDRAAGAPVANVSITIAGTTLGVRSGADGRFTIANVPSGNQRLHAARIGYTPLDQTINVIAGQTATLNISLAPASVTLDQVVVVGYGTQKRSDLTGSVSTVTPNIDQTPTTSLEEALQGTAAGVQVTTASSAPGGGISIRVRGGASVSGNNEPLYVIDGFPIENDPNNSSPTSGGRDATVTVPANPLAALNPNDIASIEILKDASATAIYGARGANGVVIITTKRGSGGKPRVTLDTYSGTQSVAKRYDLLNAKQFMQFANAWAQAQTSPSTPFANVDSLGAGIDWQSLIFRDAPMSSVQLGVTGATTADNVTRYALSGGVLQQNGIVSGSDFKRVSVRGSLDQNVGERLRFGSTLFVSRINSSQVPTDGSFNSGAGAVGAALQYIPIMPVHQSDGTYSLMSTNYPTALTTLGLTGTAIPNPVASAFEVQDRLADTRILANATGEYTIVDGLTFHTNVGTDLSNRTRDTYYPRTTLQGQGINGRAIRGDLNTTNWLTEYTLNYTRTLGSSQSVQAVAGYSRQEQTRVGDTEDNSNFVSDITGYQNIGAGNQAGGPAITSADTRWTLASYIGRVNYTILDRYLFSVTGRQDGSSRFGASNRWGFFPAAAAGWRISEEPFMRRFTAIDQLKLRYSYGIAGNPSIQPYQSLTHLTAGQYAFGSQIGAAYYPSTLGNANLGWESTKQGDAGLDLGLWHDRVDFTADYYHKRTDHLLLQVDLPSESGYTSAFENAGIIENTGIEIATTVQLLRGDDRGAFSWSTTVSAARNRNKVLDLGGVQQLFATSINSDIKASGSMVQVGQPIGVFYGYKTAGIFRDSATLAAWKAVTKMGSGSVPGLGSSIFVDVNHDGVIDANDRTVIGNPNPNFTYGWQNTISFKGFQLIGLLDGSKGGQIMNLNTYRLEGASPTGNILAARFYDAWSPTNPNGKYSKIGSGIGFLGSDFTDELVESGSYARLRSLTLSREIPSRLFKGALQNARIYVTGQNLYTWTKYSGFSPDVSSLGVANLNRGIDIGSYPMARTFTFGVNLAY